MRNRYEVLRLAEEAGITMTKTLWIRPSPAGTPAVKLVVDRPMPELVEELQDRGLL